MSTEQVTPGAVALTAIKALILLLAWPIAGLWFVADKNDDLEKATVQYILGAVPWFLFTLPAVSNALGGGAIPLVIP